MDQQRRRLCRRHPRCGSPVAWKVGAAQWTAVSDAGLAVNGRADVYGGRTHVGRGDPQTRAVERAKARPHNWTDDPGEVPDPGGEGIRGRVQGGSPVRLFVW